MAQFQFPEGKPGAVVSAPNGVVYIWDDDNKRWGMAGKTEAPPIRLTLQDVLDNGAVANKGMLLQTSDPNIEGSSEYDAITIVPAGARIMITAEDNAGWKPTLELVEVVPGVAGGTRKAQLELDDNRLDINVESREDEIHFRFADNDLLTLNYSQPSQLKGKLIVDPGTQGSQVVTYGQLATLAEEIEQLAPSFEHGQYNHSMTEVTSVSAHNGKYNLLRKNNSSDNNAARRACQDARDVCNRHPESDPIDCENQYYQCEAQIPSVGTVDTYITKFSEVEQIKFSKFDASGKEHTWGNVQVGQLIDIFNDSNDNFLVGKITAIEGTTVKTFSIDVLSSKGNATGSARIKIFSVSSDADVTNFVRKTGDEMEGQLKITGNAKNAPLFLLDPTETGKQSTLFRINDKEGEDIIEVLSNGQAFYDRAPEAEAEIANKNYVDKHVKKTGDVMTGNLTLKKKCAIEDQVIMGKDRVDFLTNSSLTIYGHSGRNDEILLNSVVRAKGDSKKDCIEYFGGTDTNDSVVNKKYVDDAIATALAAGFGAPAQYAWKMYINQNGENPAPGVCNYDEPYVKNRGVFRLSFTPLIGTPIQKRIQTVYKRGSDNPGVFATVWYHDEDGNNYRWKGSGSVMEISLKSQHIFIKYADVDCKYDGNLSNSFPYYLTVSGFF